MRKFLLALLLLPALAVAQNRDTGSGTFTGTITGYASPPTATVGWYVHGPVVILTLPTVSGTSNATTMTMTGMPADTMPATTQACLALATDNGAEVISPCTVNSTGTVTFYKSIYNGAFTGSGTKGVRQSTIMYLRY